MKVESLIKSCLPENICRTDEHETLSLSPPSVEHGSWTVVVAISVNGVIGRGDQLPWRLSNDLKRFKALTMGHCLLMGRKTFESIGRPLPGRQTIVLSRHSERNYGKGVLVAHTIDEVKRLVEPGRELMVVGGAEIYQLALPICQNIWLTRVQANVRGDTFFPAVDWSQWIMLSSEGYPASAGNDWPTEFQVWRRR